MIKIGELSNITGISIQTIRFYEKEKLICPVEVDRWTNYRYYDDGSIKRLSEIAYLKDLGFSLKEIKNLDSKTIQQKTKEINSNIKKLYQNLEIISSIVNKKGEIVMKSFVNDKAVIGKWKKVCVANSVEDYKNNKLQKDIIFDFPEIYFLKNGEEYWVFSWTKGTLFVKDRAFPYQIIDGKLFVGVKDKYTDKINHYAVYDKVDNKEYLPQEIKVEDNIDIPFVEDNKVLGYWKAINCIRKEDLDKTDKYFDCKISLLLKSYTFNPDGTLLVENYKNDNIAKQQWSKNVVIHKNNHTASEYKIKHINGKDYLFVEWKSGDYTFGGKVVGYYLFEKQ